MGRLLLVFPLLVALFGSLLHWEVNREPTPWDCERCQYIHPHEPEYLVNL